MTGISTLLSVVMLPLNLVIYTSGSYSNDVVKALDWFALFLSLVVVIGGIVIGVLSSYWCNSTRFNLLANKVGNLAGIALVSFSAIVSSTAATSAAKASLATSGGLVLVVVTAPSGSICLRHDDISFVLDKSMQ